MFSQAHKVSGSAGWVLGTYFVFVLFPLVFEVTKEGFYREMEKLQIKELKEQVGGEGVCMVCFLYCCVFSFRVLPITT